MGVYGAKCINERELNGELIQDFFPCSNLITQQDRVQCGFKQTRHMSQLPEIVEFWMVRVRCHCSSVLERGVETSETEESVPESQ